MTEKRELIEAARKFGVQYKGLALAADLLENVEGIEQAGREAQMRLDALRQQEEQARSDAEKIIEAAGQEAAAAQAEIAEQRRRDAELTDAAKREAAAIIDKAHEQAGRIVADARAISAGHEQAAEEHKKVLADIKAEIARRNGEHDIAAAKVAEAMAEHDRVTKMIEDLKAKF